LAADSQQRVNELLTNFPDKIKADLKIINAHLTKKNIDVFTCFDKMDGDQDGEVMKKDFITVLINDYMIPELTKDWASAVFDAIDRNKSGSLTIGELLMYMQGSKPGIERKTTLVTREVQE